MIATMERRGILLRARDASRQRRVTMEAEPDATVGELVQGLVHSRLNLPRTDSEGRPLTYHARLTREGRHLHAAERVEDVLRDDDEVVLQPNIQAG